MVEKIVQTVAKKFRTYGGPVGGSCNPLDVALEDQAPVFALGVDVAEVVRVVLEEAGVLR